ncbi:MAG TPA: hypothetical protein PKW95_12690 [bacterium]|nr:hypothetical protein [bacterium]
MVERVGVARHQALDDLLHHRRNFGIGQPATAAATAVIVVPIVGVVVAFIVVVILAIDQFGKRILIQPAGAQGKNAKDEEKKNGA